MCLPYPQREITLQDFPRRQRLLGTAEGYFPLRQAKAEDRAHGLLMARPEEFPGALLGWQEQTA